MLRRIRRLDHLPAKGEIGRERDGLTEAPTLIGARQGQKLVTVTEGEHDAAGRGEATPCEGHRLPIVRLGRIDTGLRAPGGQPRLDGEAEVAARLAFIIVGGGLPPYAVYSRAAVVDAYPHPPRINLGVAAVRALAGRPGDAELALVGI
jgi:hypothetical protein